MGFVLCGAVSGCVCCVSLATSQILDTEGSLSSLVIWVLTRPLRGEAVAPSNDLKSALDFTSRGSPDVPPVVPPHCDPLAPLTLEQLVAGHRGSSLLSSVRVGPMSLSDMETMLMAVLRHESIDGSVLLMLHGRCVHPGDRWCDVGLPTYLPTMRERGGGYAKRV